MFSRVVLFAAGSVVVIQKKENTKKEMITSASFVRLPETY